MHLQRCIYRERCIIPFNENHKSNFSDGLQLTGRMAFGGPASPTFGRFRRKLTVHVRNFGEIATE